MELLIVITTYERTPIPHPINTLPMSSHQQFYREICESNLSDELRSKRYIGKTTSGVKPGKRLSGDIQESR